MQRRVREMEWKSKIPSNVWRQQRRLRGGTGKKRWVDVVAPTKKLSWLERVPEWGNPEFELFSKGGDPVGQSDAVGIIP